MKSKKKPSRQEMIASCANIGPDDGIDSHEFVSEGRRRHSNRKALQLCQQVAEALNGALARCRNELLSSLFVVAVQPAPNTGRLLVTVAASASAGDLDAAEALAHLQQAAGFFRTEMAAAIHRRRTPELLFRVAVRPDTGA